MEGGSRMDSMGRGELFEEGGGGEWGGRRGVGD